MTTPACGGNIEKIQLFLKGEVIKEYEPSQYKKARHDLHEMADLTGKTCYLKYVPKSN